PSDADHRPVRAADVLAAANDDGTVHVALLHLALGRGLLDRHDDGVADAGEATLRPAEHLDAHDALGARVVGDVEIGLHLDHACDPSITWPAATVSSTRQVFFLLIGAHSSMRTTSPVLTAFASSWA